VGWAKISRLPDQIDLPYGETNRHSPGCVPHPPPSQPRSSRIPRIPQAVNSSRYAVRHVSYAATGNPISKGISCKPSGPGEAGNKEKCAFCVLPPIVPGRAVLTRQTHATHRLRRTLRRAPRARRRSSPQKANRWVNFTMNPLSRTSPPGSRRSLYTT